MSRRIAVSLCLLLFGALVPWLEIGPSHVFNTDWPAHARLHEVWQLATNSALAAWGLHAVWRHGDCVRGAQLGLIVIGGFLFAWLLRDSYGGSMRYARAGGVGELAGVDVAVACMVLAAAVLAWVIHTAKRRGA